MLTPSPVIDSGYYRKGYDVLGEDINGKPRVMNKRVDMGAHEFYFDTSLKVKLEGAEQER